MMRYLLCVWAGSMRQRLTMAMGKFPEVCRWFGGCAVITALWAGVPGHDGALAEPWQGQQRARAETLIDRLVSNGSASRASIPYAASVSVGCDSKLLYMGARGEARPGIPATPQSLYRIGSISKQFVASAIVGAITEGALRERSGRAASFQSRVSDILAEAVPWDSDADAPLTIHALLTMTASLPNFTKRPPADLDPWGAVAAKDLLAALSRLRRREATGSFEYSNTGYFLLSEILRAGGAGQTYESAVRRYALERAGLKSTGFVGEDIFQSALAKPHYRRRPAFVASSWLQGSADMVSSVEDLFAWSTALMEHRVLPRDSLSMMLSDFARVDVWTYYGMGWFISHKDGSDTYFHSGTVPGFTGFSAISRKTSGSWCAVALLTSSDSVEGLDELADEFIELASGAQR
jgi:CubicO group peptidase (beta-lactamase class C family)